MKFDRWGQAMAGLWTTSVSSLLPVWIVPDEAIPKAARWGFLLVIAAAVAVSCIWAIRAQFAEQARTANAGVVDVPGVAGTVDDRIVIADTAYALARRDILDEWAAAPLQGRHHRGDLDEPGTVIQLDEYRALMFERAAQ